jgi:hypothetical protein
MSCKKAIGVAEEMINLFGEKLKLNIFRTDSEEAREYDFRSSTNVLFDGDLIPLEISLDKQKMKDFLSEKMS